MTFVKNHGRNVPSEGPSPGKPRVLSNRPVRCTKSGTAWGPRSCGDPSPSYWSRSLGRGKAVWPPRESRGNAAPLLGGHRVRPSFGAWGSAGAATAAFAALAPAAFVAFGCTALAGAATSATLPGVVCLPAP